MHADQQDIRDESGIGSMLLWFSRLVRMQICDVEWRRHRNREGADRHGKSRWANFVALFINREAKGSQVARLKARETMRADAKRRAQPLPAAAAPAAAAACRRTRAARPIDLFREEMIKRDKRLLIKFNACSLEYWAKVRE